MTRARTLAAVRLIAVAIVAALLAGCSSGATGSGGVTTIVIWDRAGAQATIKQKFFDTWNAGPGAQAKIKVQYEPQAADKYEELVRVAFQTKHGPDIFHTPSSQLGGFVAAGWVQPLTGLVDQSVLDGAKAYLGTSSELVWGGKPYAVPTTTFTNRLVINRDLFTKAGLDPDRPPATFSELEAASRKIAAVSPGKTYGMVLPTKWVGFRQWIVDLPIMAGDADVTNGLFDRTTGKYVSTRYADMVSTYRKMITEKSAYPGAATLDTDAATAAFAKGEVGMMINSSAVVAALDQLGSTADADTAPLPVADGQRLVRSPMNAGYPFGISATTKDAKAAATVFSVLVGQDVQKALAAGNAAPLADAVWDSDAVKGNKLLQSFRPTATDQQWPKNPNSVVPVEGQTVDQTVVSLVITPDLPVDQTLAALQQRYQAGYDKAVADKTLDPGEFNQ